MRILSNNERKHFRSLVVKGHLAEIKIMMKECMIPKEWLDEDCHVYLTSKLGHLEVLKEVLKFGASVNKCFNSQWRTRDRLISPLHAAAEMGHTEIVKILVAHGAKVNAAVVEGEPDDTPLHRAAKHGHLEIVKILLENGADVNANMEGYTPLFLATMHSTSVEVVEYLLKCGANPNLTDDQKSTLLHQICELHNFHRINLKANEEDDFETPKLDFIPILIAYGADLKARNKQNLSVLDIAVTANNIRLTKILLPFYHPKSEIFHSVYPLDKFFQ